MSNYITAINDLIVKQIDRLPKSILFGENIDTGSRISGLCRNLRAPDGGRLINAGDCEATHCGAGFGIMLSGATAVLFAKQLDFMLLGVDHFVSTYNLIRCRPSSDAGSFTIITIVCDQGLQGPQSSFNALGDICSLARVDGYALTNNQDAAAVLTKQLGKPGFRFIALSQNLFSTEFLNVDLVYGAPDSSVFQYSRGEDATIVCFNFSLPKGMALQQRLLAHGMASSLFSANYVVHRNWDQIKRDVVRSRRLVVIDDSKSVHSPAYTLAYEAGSSVPGCTQIVLTRGEDVDFGVSPDTMQMDYDRVIAQLMGQVSNADR